MDTIATVPIDMSYDEPTLNEAIENTRAQFGLERIEVVQEVGPAAGSPVVRLHGERANVERALTEGWNYDRGELPEFIDA